MLSARFSLLPMLALVAGSAAAVPAMAQQTVVIAPNAPPPAQVEVIPPAPAATAYWEPGHWNWTGEGWAWVGGSYVTRPMPTAAWVPGQWVMQPGGGYVWVAGHWQS